MFIDLEICALSSSINIKPLVSFLLVTARFCKQCSRAICVFHAHLSHLGLTGKGYKCHLLSPKRILYLKILQILLCTATHTWGHTARRKTFFVKFILLLWK